MDEWWEGVRGREFCLNTYMYVILIGGLLDTYLYRLMVPIVQIRLARFQKYASAGGNM